MTLFPNHSEFAVRVLPRFAYEQLRQALWQAAAQAESWCLSDADLPLPAQSLENDWQTWLLVITPTTQALLLQCLATEASPHDDGARTCTVGLMTDPQAVAAVITHWLTTAWAEPIVQSLKIGQQKIGDRASVSGTELLLTLLPMMGVASAPQTVMAPPPEELDTHNTTQVHLKRQLQQGELLNQVITKIRNSLDLDAILSTTVAEVRQSLSADRLLIYQFQQSGTSGETVSVLPSTADPQLPAVMSGYITYESLASSTIRSVKHFNEQYCFSDYDHCQEKYRVGAPIAVNDVQATYDEAPCLQNFLRKAQVRAKVIAPILVNDQLWGLLIAHQCIAVRIWTEQELTFLKCIAEHLAVAIQQADALV